MHLGHRRPGNRCSGNVMSAISAKGRMHFMVFTETFDADVMWRFLDHFACYFDREVRLVVDGHSAHHARKGRAWHADHSNRIELHFLPSYSPGAEARRAGQRRSQTEPSDEQPGPRPGPTRRRKPQVLPPASASARHRPRLLRRTPVRHILETEPLRF
ncbi:transposase [Streptomyces sp. NPDC051917]|uniref:transposase n=1 Tax=Streptomyces sp. NPDC051917 TaxID=3154754 RepID=UPI00344EE5BD